MFNKVVALFTLVSFLLMACNDPSSDQTENESEKVSKRRQQSKMKVSKRKIWKQKRHKRLVKGM